MSRSARLRATDVRAVYELLGECRDLGDDPSAWWEHYSRRLAGLTGADLSACGEVAYPVPGKARTLGIGEWGWENGFDPEPWQASVVAYDTNPEQTVMPVYRLYFRRLADDPGACLARTDLLTDAEWADTWMFREVNEPLGVDHYLWCYRAPPAAPDQHAVVVLAREAGRRDFTAREKALVREAHALVTARVGRDLAGFRDPSPGDLSPRLRDVLRCLLEGDGDKQIAARLGIRPLTVNVHTKAIYAHFGVRGRAELLARWVRRGWAAGRPGW